jgi:hypothetical protein
MIFESESGPMRRPYLDVATGLLGNDRATVTA